jgi:hypothetical protein
VEVAAGGRLLIRTAVSDVTNPASPQVAVLIFRHGTPEDAASVAKKGNAFRRYFHERV